MPHWKTTLTIRDHTGDTIAMAQGEGPTREESLAAAAEAIRTSPNWRHGERYRNPLEGDTFITTTSLVRAS